MPPVPAPSQGEQEWDRVKAIFDGWLADCERFRDRLIEAMLKEIEEG